MCIAYVLLCLPLDWLIHLKSQVNGGWKNAGVCKWARCSLKVARTVGLAKCLTGKLVRRIGWSGAKEQTGDVFWIVDSELWIVDCEL